VTYCLQLARPVMCTAACLNADEAQRQIDEERRHLRSLELLLQHPLAVLIDAVNLEHGLCQIDAQCCNLHVGRSSLFKWVSKHLHFGILRCRLGGGVHHIGQREQQVNNTQRRTTQAAAIRFL
jgi:hypothetical protein